VKTITVISFVANPKTESSLIGWFDFKIDYTPEKWEIFRQMPYFKSKDDRGNFVSMPSFKRAEQWMKYFERSSIRDLLKELSENAIIYMDKEKNPTQPLVDNYPKEASIFEDEGLPY